MSRENLNMPHGAVLQLYLDCEDVPISLPPGMRAVLPVSLGRSKRRPYENRWKHQRPESRAEA
jgi:hypothetical protein